MRKRKKMTKARSRRNFRSGARVNRRNVPRRRPMRGGIRA